MGFNLYLQGEIQSPKTVPYALPNAEKTQGSKNHWHDGIIDPASHFPTCQAARPLLTPVNCVQLQRCLPIPLLAIQQPGRSWVGWQPLCTLDSSSPSTFSPSALSLALVLPWQSCGMPYCPDPLTKLRNLIVQVFLNKADILSWCMEGSRSGSKGNTLISPGSPISLPLRHCKRNGRKYWGNKH